MISVVVPAYNAAGTLDTCLRALIQQSLPRSQYEVIVVDDGSTDETALMAETFGAQVICQHNQGPAVARNRGVEAAQGDLILFTDADCEPAPDWIEQMTAPLADPDVVGAKGTYRTCQREPMARFVQIEYEDKYDRLARQSRIDFVDTYSAAYRRTVFLENGGFDPVFSTASVEDQELSFRLSQKGYRLVFAPAAIVYHQHDRTIGEYVRRKFGIGYWKALLVRWHPEKVVRDSHTPQTLKAQIVLLGLLGLALIAWPVWQVAGWGALALAVAFVLTTLSFLLKVLRRDARLLPMALPALTLRAAALGAGLVAGYAHFAFRASPHKPVLSPFNRFAKRAMDIVGALLGLILTSPLMVALAVLIKLDSPGPVLFKQTRVGENGRSFRIIKLRSMVDGAESRLAEVVDVERLDSPAFKIKNDPRVTRIGRFLRRTSLDELPQFWNVLVGDMSLIGPRPEEAYIVQKYNDWHRKRLAVKPGLTGPMQVNGRGDLPLDERVRLELDYIQHYSLWRDIVILARTLPAWISGKGAY
jgi:lipopolysaccharide/colanic/teichoic acid biosynthesis glycosyltransferase/glycosyltransferase involved in cell wall biosynthesis